MMGQDSAQTKGMWYKIIIQVSWQEGGSGLLPFERGEICSVSFRALNWRFWYILGIKIKQEPHPDWTPNKQQQQQQQQQQQNFVDKQIIS